MYSFFLPFFMAAFVTMLLIVTLKPLANRIGWVDKPDNLRKLHCSAVPLTGGVAMMIAYATSLFFLDNCQGQCNHIQLMSSLLLLCALGIWDDIKHLSAKFRLLLQAGIAYLLIASTHTYLNDMGNLFGLGDIVLGSTIGTIFTVFCIVGIINAMNMIDGIDGLSAGLALIALVGIKVLTQSINLNESIFIVALLGCLAGYLMFNMRGPIRKKASVFMGDAGSMVLGAAIAWLMVSLSQPSFAHPSLFSPVLALWLLAIPTLDTICLIIKRKRQGKSPFAADRDHLHHTFKTAGLSDIQTTLVILAMAGAIMLFAVTLSLLNTPEAILMWLFIIMGIAYYFVVHHKPVLATLFNYLLNGQNQTNQQ